MRKLSNNADTLGCINTLEFLHSQFSNLISYIHGCEYTCLATCLATQSPQDKRLISLWFSQELSKESSHSLDVYEFSEYTKCTNLQKHTNCSHSDKENQPEDLQIVERSSPELSFCETVPSLLTVVTLLEKYTLIVFTLGRKN